MKPGVHSVRSGGGAGGWARVTGFAVSGDVGAGVCVRRSFMAEVLGIALKPEVLPLSNLAGYLPPFWLSPQLAMRRK